MMIEGFNFGRLKTQSNIVVAADGYTYFQGTDHAVWRVNVAEPGHATRQMPLDKPRGWTR